MPFAVSLHPPDRGPLPPKPPQTPPTTPELPCPVPPLPPSPPYRLTSPPEPTPALFPNTGMLVVLETLTTPPVALTVVNPAPAKLVAPPAPGAAGAVVPAVPPAPIVTVIDAPGVRPDRRFRA